MNAARSARKPTQARNELGLREAPDEKEFAAYWNINGYRAKLLIWTADEWEGMKNLPSDAQFHPAGFWCALRID